MCILGCKNKKLYPVIYTIDGLIRLLVTFRLLLSLACQFLILIHQISSHTNYH